MSTRRFALLLALIATVACAGRAAYILAETRFQSGPVFASGVSGVHRSFDEYYYSQGAIAFAAGDGLRFSPVVGAPASEQGVHPPLTSVLLAPAAGLTDGNETAMRFTVIPLLAPIVIATLTAAAFYGLARFRAPAEVSVVALAAVPIDAWIGRRHAVLADASRP